MSKVLIIRPHELSPPGIVATALDRNAISYQEVNARNGTEIPRNLEQYDGLVILGGSQGVGDHEHAGLIDACKTAVLRFHDKKLPVLGICLGAQIIASAFGATVFKSSRLHLGFREMIGTSNSAQDDLLANIALPQPAFIWHQDEFAIPANATRLLTSSDAPNYGFHIGSVTYGFQCHFEVTQSIIDRMVSGGMAEINKRLGETGAKLVEQLPGIMETELAAAMTFGTTIAERWAQKVKTAAN